MGGEWYGAPMEIIVLGFIVGVCLSPILVIWLYVRMIRRDQQRARAVQAGNITAAQPRGYIERRMHQKYEQDRQLGL